MEEELPPVVEEITDPTPDPIEETDPTPIEVKEPEPAQPDQYGEILRRLDEQGAKEMQQLETLKETVLGELVKIAQTVQAANTMLQGRIEALETIIRKNHIKINI